MTKSNNKGFTLVELLVAMAVLVIVLLEVYTVMNNSNQLYLRGSYDVDLQTEAQQMILQVEDMLIDANGRVDYSVDHTNNTKTLNIINLGSVSSCTIQWREDSDAIDAGYTYGKLWYYSFSSPSSNTALKTFTAPTPAGDGILLADYVEDFNVDMSDYTNNRVNLIINMKNEKYSYSTEKTVFLRNEIGNGGSSSNTSASGTHFYSLDVLRFKEYNLADGRYMYYDDSEKKYYKYDTFKFRGQSSDSQTNDNTYLLSDSGGTNNILKARNLVNNDFNTAYGPYVIEGKCSSKASAPTIEIQITTDKVIIGSKAGSAGNGMYQYNGSSSYPISIMTQVLGISLADATSVSYSYNWYSPTGTKYQDPGSMFTKSPTKSVEYLDVLLQDSSDSNGSKAQGLDSEWKEASHTKVAYFAVMKPISANQNFFKVGGSKINNQDTNVLPYALYVDIASNSLGSYTDDQFSGNNKEAFCKCTAAGYYTNTVCTFTYPGSKKITITLYPFIGCSSDADVKTHNQKMTAKIK